MSSTVYKNESKCSKIQPENPNIPDLAFENSSESSKDHCAKS